MMFSLVDNIIGDSLVSQTWLCQPVSSNVAREFKPYLIRYGFKGRASCDWQMKQHSRLFKACFGHHFNPILSWSGFRISRFAKPLRSSTESAVFSQSKLNIIEATVTSELGHLQQKTGAIICYDTSHGMRMYLERDAANNLIWLWKKHGPFLKVVLYGR